MKGLFERCSAACFHADKASRHLADYRVYYDEAHTASAHLERASVALKRAAKSLLRRYHQGGYQGADDDERRDAAAFDRCAHALQNVAMTEAACLMDVMESDMAADGMEGSKSLIQSHLYALLTSTAAVEDAAGVLVDDDLAQ